MKKLNIKISIMKRKIIFLYLNKCYKNVIIKLIFILK